MKLHWYYMVFMYTSNNVTGHRTHYIAFEKKGLNVKKIKYAQDLAVPDTQGLMINAMYIGYMTKEQLEIEEDGI